MKVHNKANPTPRALKSGDRAVFSGKTKKIFFEDKNLDRLTLNLGPKEDKSVHSMNLSSVQNTDSFRRFCADLAKTSGCSVNPSLLADNDVHQWVATFE